MARRSAMFKPLPWLSDANMVGRGRRKVVGGGEGPDSPTPHARYPPGVTHFQLRGGGGKPPTRVGGGGKIARDGQCHYRYGSCRHNCNMNRICNMPSVPLLGRCLVHVTQLLHCEHTHALAVMTGRRALRCMHVHALT